MGLTPNQTPEEPVSPEAKWEANRAKVAFALAFPGLLADWKDAQGKTIDAVVPAGETTAVLFTDGTFGLIPVRERDPASVVAALAAARPRLESFHADAYGTLDGLEARDRELARRARVEKVLGAIRHNAVEMPELKDAVRRLVASWTDHPNSHGQTDQTPSG
jgi:hypothetical protein